MEKVRRSKHRLLRSKARGSCNPWLQVIGGRKKMMVAGWI
jgi:hypothetical protein